MSSILERYMIYFISLNPGQVLASFCSWVEKYVRKSFSVLTVFIFKNELPVKGNKKAKRCFAVLNGPVITVIPFIAILTNAKRL